METKSLGTFRSEANPLGLMRVMKPTGAFPQAAFQLDASLPLYRDELLISVDRLNLDSASFRQLIETCGRDERALATRIEDIVRERGKMQNPVTGSGGMLLGTVTQKGESCPHPFDEGQRIATLVSLTLTPLHLERVHEVDFSRGQVEVVGHAILFASGVAATIPDDWSEDISLALLDVCGAPAWVKRYARPRDRVLIQGLGKAGLLSALAAGEVVGSSKVWVSDMNEERLAQAWSLGLQAHYLKGDLRDPIAYQYQLEESGAPEFDLVVNTCNGPDTEMGSLLAAAPRGRILFFNMATDFSRAVLAAEGIGLDAELIMGNGFAEGHGEFVLQLMRRHPNFLGWFEAKKE